MFGKILYWSIKVLGYLLILAAVFTSPDLDVLGLFGINNPFISRSVSYTLSILWILQFWFFGESKDEKDIIL